jgi:pyruvate dehydrogenase E2 component (dihydrolipoamide acetyltransferase)
VTYGFRFTDVGEGLEEGEIVAWLVAVGDTVESYQPLVSVETDKSVVDLPSPVAGRVLALHGAPGDIVKVGSLLVEIESATADVGAARQADSLAAVSALAGELPPPAPISIGRVKASPATRKLAVELDVDIASVTPTGPEGRVTVDDVRSASTATHQPDRPSPPTSRNSTQSGTSSPRLGGEQANVGGERSALASTLQPDPSRPPTSPNSTQNAGSTKRLEGEAAEVGGSTGYGTQPLRGLRKRTAEVMAQSWSNVPHISCMDETDATELLAARDRLRRAMDGNGPKLTALAFAVKAAALALHRFPTMNASIDMAAGTMTLHKRVNIGLAVATDDGLVVPVLTDADQRSLRSIAAEIERLTTAARQRSLRPTELRDGTFTITNYGSFGGTWGSPIIRPPEAGILGLGAIKPRPFVVDGQVMARSTLPLVVSADHRLVDGDVLGSFLMFVAGLLSDPVRMLLED